MSNISLIDGHIDNAEHCVCCGAVIPEGRQVCIICGLKTNYKQSTADVVEVRHGKWIDLHDEDVLYEQTYKCSVCGECFVLETGTPQENEYNYCPNCGAKMDGKDGE